MKGLMGRKLGMTQVFTNDGTLIPVTVVEVIPNVVTQKKTVENDGYVALQLGMEDLKESKATKANKGHAAKANTTAKRFYHEFKSDEMADLEVGATVTADLSNSLVSTSTEKYFLSRFEANIVFIIKVLNVPDSPVINVRFLSICKLKVYLPLAFMVMSIEPTITIAPFHHQTDNKQLFLNNRVHLLHAHCCSVLHTQNLHPKETPLYYIM